MPSGRTACALGFGLLLALPGGCLAASVQPGGNLDLTLSGRIRAKAFGGDLAEARLDRSVSNGLDFASDIELDLLAKAEDAATGVVYGGLIELESEAGEALDTKAAWVFVRGAFGEFRFGDDDPPSEDDKVGGFSVAAGTGGIDGAVVDTIAVSVVGPSNSGSATKLVYRSPTYRGLGLNVSYAPNPDNGDAIAAIDVETGDYVEGSVLYEGSLGEVDILASLVGGVCSVKDDAEAAGQSCRTLFGGATMAIDDLEIAAGYGDESIAGVERRWWNAGIAWNIGAASVSLTYGMAVRSEAVVNGNTLHRPRNLVVSADLELLPGLTLEGDVGIFDNDVDAYDPDADESGGDGDVRDRGLQAVARVALEF